ncbi:uncharacterized protein N0V89_009049 [Didymosphaeria variabile]|uniref:Uncharacterized protein n=1 Tax=Didymosphaeria variabile TaxID=1932322 RepID=A0A9W8XHL3_9PLEO|nr:uncharacterized protein N0V89_009049 [Didymosphaeria variabile]KAJ4350428.1 hypothetical protein N0V89_009049 [Didymosphaeria variabile]
MEPTANEDTPPGLPKGITRKPVPINPTLDAAPTKPQAKHSFAPLTYIALILLGTALLSWRWILSGTPFLVCSLSIGDWNGKRVFPRIPLWPILIAVNATYTVASTSWVLYWGFVAICYTAVLLSCLYQFGFATRIDSISLFDLPALEIDKDTVGLFVVRGLTFSLSTLTATAYGIEVGVKLDEDMELSIQTDKVVVALFRRITIGDVYANVKGRDEMTFKDVPQFPNERDMSKDTLIARDTLLLKAAYASAKNGFAEIQEELHDAADTPLSSNTLVRKLSPDEEKARTEVEKLTKHILNTSTSHIAQEMLRKIAKEREIDGVLDSENNLRAAVCAHVHEQPTVAHPPSKSIRLTTLSHNKHPKFKKFVHRLPLLYRLLLNPISYFHPIRIKSVTSAGSGKWFVSLMKDHFFKHYSTSDAEVRRLESRISAWLADANFAVGLTDLFATAQVPVDTDYDIECKFKIGDLMAHRTLPEAVNLTQVVHLGGADATFVLPSYLLPHHEHLFPPILTDFDEMRIEQEIEEMAGTPQAVRMKKDLERRQKDETCMKIAVHGHLPALFDQQLLNFVAATVKATKVIEVEKGHEELVLKRAANDKLEMEIRRVDSVASDSVAPESIKPDNASASSTESDTATMGSQNSVPVSTQSTPTSLTPNRGNTWKVGMNKAFKGMNTKIQDGWRKAGIQTVNVVANDRWIASIIGRIMRKLEKAQGDVGYSGLITMPMAEYRERAELETKLLP